MIRVVVSGAAGRMGQTVCAAVDSAEDLELTGRADPLLGVSLADVVRQADVVVDFSQPGQAIANVETCLHAGVHAVVGTTGFAVEELRARIGPGGRERVLVAPNFAIGAVLMMRLAAQAARHMPAVEIIELHHEGKLDAPSGTAKRTAALIAQATGGAEPPIHSVRLPGLVASQEVVLGALAQTLCIRHDTTSREAFMPGVLLAVRRVAQLPERLTVGLDALLS